MWTKPTNPPSAAHVPAAEPLSPTTVRQRIPGRRFGQMVKLKPEFVQQFKEAHAHVWPEVLKQIKGCNIQDYSIFHDPETNILFAAFRYVGYDYEGDMERMRENPKVREWWAMTDGWQESMVPGATGSGAEPPAPGWWKPMEEVFFAA